MILAAAFIQRKETHFGAFGIAVARIIDICVPLVSGTAVIIGVMLSNALKAVGGAVSPRYSMPATRASQLTMRKKPMRVSSSIAFCTSTVAFMTLSVSARLYTLNVYQRRYSGFVYKSNRVTMPALRLIRL